MCFTIFGNRGQWNNMSIWEYAAMHMNLVPFKTIDSYVKALVHGNMNFNRVLENIKYHQMKMNTTLAFCMLAC